MLWPIVPTDIGSSPDDSNQQRCSKGTVEGPFKGETLPFDLGYEGQTRQDGFYRLHGLLILSMSDKEQQLTAEVKEDKVQEATVPEQKETEEQVIEVKEEEPEEERFISADLALSDEIKGEANELFKQKEYMEAIRKYQEAISFTPKEEGKKRSVLYSNIAICLTKMQDDKEAIKYCKKAIACDQTYIKPHKNLAMAYERTDDPEEALSSYKKIVELTPKDVSVHVKIKEMEKKVQDLNEKRKEEVIGGLKTLGNNFLGLFGMSLDNFKLEQGAGGGYNISYKQ